jgi:hypothetical protein
VAHSDCRGHGMREAEMVADQQALTVCCFAFLSPSVPLCLCASPVYFAVLCTALN